jgi:histidine ammonia-lyase
MDTVVIDGENLTLEMVMAISRGDVAVLVSNEARTRIMDSRRSLDRILESGEIAYGVNTGVGDFENVVIPRDRIATLQRNLIRSTAAGVGDPLSKETAKAMMLLRANALAKGYSGVRLELVDLIVEMINRDVIPVVPKKGSVGSSGDLVPLAHIALVVMGEGEAWVGGERLDGGQALERVGLDAIELQAKEGLALINGTQLMCAIGCICLNRALLLLKAAQIALAMSLESLSGTDHAFDERLFKVRPHPGPLVVARNLRLLLSESEIVASHRECCKVQDAYTLRCGPQVLGAVMDSLSRGREVLEIEINSATDNPLIFEGEALSGGNFHGEPLALALDAMALAVHEISSFSERRIARLLDGKLSGLPRFLTRDEGVDSGLMITQYVAAALTSESKLMATNASADSIPTSANQEDFNSMGSIAADKLERITGNAELVVAIELLCAAQALEFHSMKPGLGSTEALSFIRENVDRVIDDRPLSKEIEWIRDMIVNGRLVERVEEPLPIPLE